MKLVWYFVLSQVLLFAPAKADSEAKPATEPILTVIDEAGSRHQITAADLSRLPRQKLKAKSERIDGEFEGVSLVDLLKSAGVAFGDGLKGKRAATVAVCEAADGYRVTFALLEIDPDTTDRHVLVADHRDGQPLGDKEGPLRLVIPGEKRPIRWIRMLRTIRILNPEDSPKDALPTTKPPST